jgi:hypothetical protein
MADLKAARSDKLTDNFLIFGANPGNVDWLDDAGWREIRQHCRLLARLAHEGGLRGLLFDPEPYTEPYKQCRPVQWRLRVAAVVCGRFAGSDARQNYTH